MVKSRKMRWSLIINYKVCAKLNLCWGSWREVPCDCKKGKGAIVKELLSEVCFVWKIELRVAFRIATSAHTMKRCTNVIVQKKAVKNRSNSSSGGDCCICDEEKEWPRAAATGADAMHGGCQQQQQQQQHQDQDVECRRDWMESIKRGKYVSGYNTKGEAEP